MNLLAVDFVLTVSFMCVKACYVVKLICISFQLRLKKEQEEKEDKKRYKAQAHLFTIIKVLGFAFLLFCGFLLCNTSWDLHYGWLSQFANAFRLHEMGTLPNRLGRIYILTL